MGRYYDNIGELSNDESRLLRLVDTCKDMDVFIHENRIYLGNKVQAAKRFCKETQAPSDFSVWLQDNYKQLSYV